MDGVHFRLCRYVAFLRDVVIDDNETESPAREPSEIYESRSGVQGELETESNSLARSLKISVKESIR